MFNKTHWPVAVAVVALLACGDCAWGQIYSAPSIGTVQNQFGAPTIATRNSGLEQGLLNSGFGGGNAPINSLLPSMSSIGQGRIGLGLGDGSPSTKPFTGLTPQPTVSPYLNLFRVDLSGNSDLNYSTLVQPQLQQQQLNEQLQRQTLQTNRRLTAITAQAQSNPAGSKDEYPTGHQTVFNYKGHYYTTPRPHPKHTVQQQ